MKLRLGKCCVPLRHLSTAGSPSRTYTVLVVVIRSYAFNYKASFPLAQGFGLVTPDPLPLWVGSEMRLGYHCSSTCFECHWQYSSQERPTSNLSTPFVIAVVNWCLHAILILVVKLWALCLSVGNHCSLQLKLDRKRKRTFQPSFDD